MSLSVVDNIRRYPVLPIRVPRISDTTRWAIGAAGICAVAALALFVLELVRDPVRFPVTNVDVLGTLDYTDREQLRKRVAGFTDAGFYALDIDGLRASVESLPWVAEARIGREWPGRLQVTVEEHEPAARWNDDGLVSKSLEMFRPPQLERDNVRFADWQRVFSSLPSLEGADGRHPTVLDDYRRYSDELGTLGLVIGRLVEDDRHSQTLELGGGVTVRLGYESRETRFARFLEVYPRLAASLAGAPSSFDMRYSNGFALRTDSSGAATPGTNALVTSQPRTR